MAYIVRKPESALTAEEVMKFVAEQVSTYCFIQVGCEPIDENNSLNEFSGFNTITNFFVVMVT